MHFGGANRKGNIVAGGLKYVSGLNRFQADVAAGQFSGVNRDGTLTKERDVAINLTGSYQLTDQARPARPLCLRGPKLSESAKRNARTHQPRSGQHQLATAAMVYGRIECQHCNDSRESPAISIAT